MPDMRNYCMLQSGVQVGSTGVKLLCLFIRSRESKAHPHTEQCMPSVPEIAVITLRTERTHGGRTSLPPAVYSSLQRACELVEI